MVGPLYENSLRKERTPTDQLDSRWQMGSEISQRSIVLLCARELRGNGNLHQARAALPGRHAADLSTSQQHDKDKMAKVGERKTEGNDTRW
jgi:hypothetical protein